MAKTKTLIVSDDRLKEVFKAECTKNGKEMSEVTSLMWKQYIVASVTARKERYENYKEKQTSKSTNENETIKKA